MKIPYDVVRFEDDRSWLEVRRFDEPSGHWNITAHWKHFSNGNYYNTACIAYSPHHPEQSITDNEGMIWTLAHYASGSDLLEPQARIVRLIHTAISTLSKRTIK